MSAVFESRGGMSLHRGYHGEEWGLCYVTFTNLKREEIARYWKEEIEQHDGPADSRFEMVLSRERKGLRWRYTGAFIRRDCAHEHMAIKRWRTRS